MRRRQRHGFSGSGQGRLVLTLADELYVRYADAHRAFGSLLLPVKAEVRQRERIEDGDTATILIALDE